MAWRTRLRAYLAENERAIKAGAITNAIFFLPAIRFSVPIVFAGAIGGWIAGHLTPRYGPSLRNGAVVGVLGVVIPTALTVLVGALLWALLGPNVAWDLGRFLVGTSVVFVPLYAVEGAVGSVAASWFAAGR